MSIKSGAARLLAAAVTAKIQRESLRGPELQLNVMKTLLRRAAATRFGAEHRFSSVASHAEFRDAVPVRDYEQIKPWIGQVMEGAENVLWPGKPLYFCKTSGTTSGTKYIPLTRESMPNHIGSARNALLSYIAQTGDSSFVNGRMIFLQGSPALDRLPSGIPYGRLSGIVANHVPAYLQKNRLPSYATNCIEDWETKVNAIAEETMSEDMRLISGIPAWVQMYFEILLKKSGKSTIAELFPNFSLFVFGGVNFGPYRPRFDELIGRKIPSLETFPASEGFIAYQDSQEDEGLLLNVNSGIFFEFIPVSEVHRENPTRLTLGDVRIGENYALVLSNNAGLWSYSIGDTVRFVSLDPPRIRVTGRIKHFTSAFGEHVIAEEVERAMAAAIRELGLRVSEFHVAPVIVPESGLPYHHWLVEFDELPVNPEAAALYLNDEMTRQNIYYRDLIAGNVLRPLVITPLGKGAFQRYMKSVGRLGGQNKVQRLANDHLVADELIRLSS
jgi:hypothetical protein